jgi:D-alanyl-D-alanine carboxypeptidase/D-alanyl-D-alanine-endopeptidase (penicillin-binding protein 4)
MMHDAMIPLRAAADSTLAHGIRAINGRLTSGSDAFPGSDVNSGWEWDDLTEAYGAGVDELMFNEGFTNITLRPGKRAGSLATVSTAPLPDYPPVLSHVVTGTPFPGAPNPDLTVAFDVAHGGIHIDGSVAPHDSATLMVAYPDQTTAYLFAFADALRAAGIAVPAHAVAPPVETLPVSTSRETAPPSPAKTVGHPVDTLFTITSPPLREVLAAMLKPSQNQIAEVLLRTLGLEITGVGLADSGRRVIEEQLSAWGVPTDGYVIHDGSGLSRHDFVSPATLVRILTMMAADSTFQAFYDALPIAGVDGTLETRMRATAAAGNVRAKTGSVDRARSLSGYVTTADGTRLVFSLLCNNWTTSVHDVEQVQDLISARLASLDLRTK